MHFTRKQLGIPYILFLILFVVLPLFVVLYYAFTDGQGQFTVENFQHFFTNGKTLGTLFYSFVIALLTTTVCLFIAYPTAYILARGGFRKSGVWMLLLVTPMWINFTLRITALKEVLNLIEGNLAFHPLFNAVLCMVYDFLPFMILPIYTVLLKLDGALPEAAADLGAKRHQVFFKVILPLSMPGIISGVTMVFLPAMTNYVVLDMVYNIVNIQLARFESSNPCQSQFILFSFVISGFIVRKNTPFPALHPCACNKTSRQVLPIGILF